MLTLKTMETLAKDENSFLINSRKEALKLFEELPLPKFKYGRSLVNKIDDFDISKLNPTKSKINIRAPKEVDVVQVEEAINNEKYKRIIEEFFMKRAFYPAENKFTALHAAFWTNAIIINIPKNISVKEPIELNQKVEDTAISHVLVIAGENSSATILDCSASEKPAFLSKGVEIIAREGSNITYETLQNLNDDSWYFSVQRAIVSNSANVNWFSAPMGSKFSKIEVSSDLTGEGSSTNNLGIFIGTDEKRFDVYNSAIHSAPNTESDMNNKGIVNDKSKSIYRGLITIKENSKNSNGYQKQDTLILSRDAEADAVPNLEINNNEVKCSHGATIGQIDDEKLFYMMSRGLTKKQAEKEIVTGFLTEMIDRSKSKVMKEKMLDLMRKRLEC